MKHPHKYSMFCVSCASARFAQPTVAFSFIPLESIAGQNRIDAWGRCSRAANSYGESVTASLGWAPFALHSTNSAPHSCECQIRSHSIVSPPWPELEDTNWIDNCWVEVPTGQGRGHNWVDNCCVEMPTGGGRGRGRVGLERPQSSLSPLPHAHPAESIGWENVTVDDGINRGRESRSASSCMASGSFFDDRGSKTSYHAAIVWKRRPLLHNTKENGFETNGNQLYYFHDLFFFKNGIEIGNLW